MKESQFLAAFEDIDSKFELMIEMISSLMDLPQKVATIDERLNRVEMNLEAALKVITGHSQELNGHEFRITKLEAL